MIFLDGFYNVSSGIGIFPYNPIHAIPVLYFFFFFFNFFLNFYGESYSVIPKTITFFFIFMYYEKRIFGVDRSILRHVTLIDNITCIFRILMRLS